MSGERRRGKMKGRQPTPAAQHCEKVPSSSQSQALSLSLSQRVRGEIRAREGKRTILYVSISWLLRLPLFLCLCMPPAHRTPSVAPGATISENVFCIHSYEYGTRCGSSPRIERGLRSISVTCGVKMYHINISLSNLNLTSKRKSKCFITVNLKMPRWSTSELNAIK